MVDWFGSFINESYNGVILKTRQIYPDDDGYDQKTSPADLRDTQLSTSTLMSQSRHTDK